MELRPMRWFGLVAFLAVPHVLSIVSDETMSGAAVGSAQDMRSSGRSSVPAFIGGTLRAVPLPGGAPSSTPNFQPVGTPVPKADIVATAADSQRVVFGLAVYRVLMGATYPAISTDHGATWRIDGPRFYVAAAQAASVTGDVGALGPHGAYFWGQGGNSVEVTTDEGAHWWITGFAAGVYKVSATRGSLRTVALGDQVRGGAFQAFLYVSANSGKTWNLHGQLRNVKL